MMLQWVSSYIKDKKRGEVGGTVGLALSKNPDSFSIISKIIHSQLALRMNNVLEFNSSLSK